MLNLRLNSNYFEMIWSFGIKAMKYKGIFKYKFPQNSNSNANVVIVTFLFKFVYSNNFIDCNDCECNLKMKGSLCGLLLCYFSRLKFDLWQLT